MDQSNAAVSAWDIMTTRTLFVFVWETKQQSQGHSEAKEEQGRETLFQQGYTFLQAVNICRLPQNEEE